MRAYSTKYFSSSTSLSFHFLALFFITTLVLVSCRSLLAPNFSTHVCRRGPPTSSLDTEKRRVSILHDEREAPSPTAFASDNHASPEFNEVYLSPSVNFLEGTKSIFHMIEPFIFFQYSVPSHAFFCGCSFLFLITWLVFRVMKSLTPTLCKKVRIKRTLKVISTAS